MFDEEKLKLLGRIAFGPEPEAAIKKIISSGKKGSKAKDYIKGYNSLDGENSINDIAKIIGVTTSTLSPILQKWADIGIVFEVEGRNKKLKFYKKLFQI